MSMTASEIVDCLRIQDLYLRQFGCRENKCNEQAADLIESLQSDNQLKQNQIEQLEAEIEQLKADQPVRHEKPPLGITRDLWLEMSKSNLTDTIIQYAKANQKIPLEWVTEYNGERRDT